MKHQGLKTRRIVLEVAVIVLLAGLLTVLPAADSLAQPAPGQRVAPQQTGQQQTGQQQAGQQQAGQQQTGQDQALPGDAARDFIKDSKKVPVGENFMPKKIVISKTEEELMARLDREITLDVREMNVVDVLKFLALKGDFNLVTSSQVQGRVTLYLKNVKIKDALDIALISNGLAYHVERDIIHVITDQEYEYMYGRRFNEKDIVEIITLKYAKPSYVLSALEGVKSTLGRVIIDEDTGSVVLIDTPESIDKMKMIIGQIENPLETIVYSLQYAKAVGIVDQLKAKVDANTVGSVTADERTNSVIVRAYSGRKTEVEKLIKGLDVATKEVLVDMRVIQVVFKPQMDFGIDWDAEFASKDVKFSSFMLDENNLASSDNLFSKYGRIGIGFMDGDGFEARIRALKQVSDTKILSNPKILVTNNEEAKIHVGDTVPYIISTTSGTGENAITSEDVRFVDVGLKLGVIPTINDDGFITIVMKPEISTVTGTIASAGGGIPKVNKTMIETTVMVKDGMTVVMGGLKKDNKVSVNRGVPVLMDLPFLGNFFQSRSESIESTEIVIFITPHIIKGDEDQYNEYRGQVKKHMGYKTPEQESAASKLKLKE